MRDASYHVSHKLAPASASKESMEDDLMLPHTDEVCSQMFGTPNILKQIDKPSPRDARESLADSAAVSNLESCGFNVEAEARTLDCRKICFTTLCIKNHITKLYKKKTHI